MIKNIKINPFKKGSLLGFVTVTFELKDGTELVVSGYKLMKTDKGAFVGAPSQKSGETWIQTVYPAKNTKEFNAKLLELTIAEYKKLASETEAPAPPPKKTSPFDLGDDLPF